MVAKVQMLPNVAEPVNIKKHGSMPRGNTECFCRVAETYFCFLETKIDKIDWVTLEEHVRATDVSGNMFRRVVCCFKLAACCILPEHNPSAGSSYNERLLC